MSIDARGNWKVDREALNDPAPHRQSLGATDDFEGKNDAPSSEIR